MRVISGKLKGRHLVSFQGGHIRPTTDRVKESIFNKLMGEIEDQRILDLFSGTGNLAIESHSRGAAYVECVELSKRSVEIIKKNLEQLKITSGVKLLQKDVFKYLKSYQGEPFAIIFVDPPFTEKWADQVMQAIGESQVIAESTKVVIESAGKEKIGDSYGPLKLLDRKDFGDKQLSIFHYPIKDAT